MAEHHAEILADQTNIEKFMTALTNALNDRPRVANLACLAINHFATALQPVDMAQESNALTPFYQGLLQTVFNNSGREDYQGQHNEIISNHYVAFSGLVQHSCSSSNAITC